MGGISQVASRGGPVLSSSQTRFLPVLMKSLFQVKLNGMLS